MATPTELGKIFLDNFPVDTNGYSKEVTIDELVTINPDFRTKNGCHWARSDVSWLGRRFNIKRTKIKGKVYSVQLVGFNTPKNHSIPNDVRRYYKEAPCAMFGVQASSMEIDHKDARYPDKKLSIEDFQPLSKAANDAKRECCKKCLSTKKRFDATKLGFNVSFIQGDIDSNFCQGCFWYDIKLFRKVVSQKGVSNDF